MYLQTKRKLIQHFTYTMIAISKGASNFISISRLDYKCLSTQKKNNMHVKID